MFYDADLEAVHDKYITTFIQNFNAGHKKRLFPVWLKAPGGQLFYWGRLPRFTGQKIIVELIVRYREYYYGGGELGHVVTDEVVKRYSYR